MLFLRRAAFAAIFVTGIAAHSRTGHDNHPAIRRRVGSQLKNVEQSLQERTTDVESELVARSPALDPADGTILDSSDVGFYDGTENDDCSCECAPFDDIISKCLEDGGDKSACSCNANTFGDFINCAMCDSSYYSGYDGGLRGFVMDALTDCKLANHPFSLNIDMSTLPTSATNNTRDGNPVLTPDGLSLPNHINDSSTTSTTTAASSTSTSASSASSTASNTTSGASVLPNGLKVDPSSGEASPSFVVVNGTTIQTVTPPKSKSTGVTEWSANAASHTLPLTMLSTLILGLVGIAILV